MKAFKTLCLALPLAALPLCAQRASAEPGLTGAPILSRPVGARSSGMGRAFTAVPGEAESVMYNPAGTAFIPAASVYVAYMNGFGGGHYGAVAAPVRLGRMTLTPSFVYYNSGSMNLDLSDGTSGSVTAEFDKVGALSAAFRPSPRLALGGTLKFTSISLAETASASARHYDLGALYRVTDSLCFGASAMNNGQSIKFEGTGAPPPATLRAGLTYKTEFDAERLDSSSDVSYSDIVLTADWSRAAKESERYQAGAEMNMRMRIGIMLSLRAGYLFDRDDEGLTFGIGIRQHRWTFGVAYEASRDLNNRVPVSITYVF